MICLGVILMASTIIPLTFDDENEVDLDEDIHNIALDRACMATPWLFSIGFTTTFSALFSKTWRVNRIFHNPGGLTRVKVTAKDVMGPFVGLMSINIIVLTCWTIVAPLVYKRYDHEGTDDWNRKISSYGICVTDSDAAGGTVPYIIILAVVNLGVLFLANVQAYQARSIQTEFSESKYISIIMASLLQACIMGLPIMILVKDLPQVYYVVLVCLITIICVAVLTLMFVPKIMVLLSKEPKHRGASSGRSSVRVSGLDLTENDINGTLGLKINHRLSSLVQPSEEFTNRQSIGGGMLDSIVEQTATGSGAGGDGPHSTAAATTGDGSEYQPESAKTMTSSSLRRISFSNDTISNRSTMEDGGESETTPSTPKKPLMNAAAIRMAPTGELVAINNVREPSMEMGALVEEPSGEIPSSSSRRTATKRSPLPNSTDMDGSKVVHDFPGVTVARQSIASTRGADYEESSMDRLASIIAGAFGGASTPRQSTISTPSGSNNVMPRTIEFSYFDSKKRVRKTTMPILFDENQLSSSVKIGPKLVDLIEQDRTSSSQKVFVVGEKRQQKLKDGSLCRMYSNEDIGEFTESAFMDLSLDHICTIAKSQPIKISISYLESIAEDDISDDE